jgi:hypothetical protein
LPDWTVNRLLNAKLSALVAGLDQQSRLLDAKLSAVIEESSALNAKIDAIIAALSAQPVSREPTRSAG